MTTNRKKPIHHYNVTFRVNFILCTDMPIHTFDQYMRDEFGTVPAIEANMHGLCQELYNATNGAHAIVVWTAPNSGIDTIAHELIHAINKAFLSRGYDPDARNDEPQAYMMSELLRAIYPVNPEPVDTEPPPTKKAKKHGRK